VLPPYYRIEMFGGLCLIADGRVTVRFHSEAAEALLACITYRPEVRYRRADLGRMLWTDLAPIEAAACLDAAIATLRLHLEPTPIPSGRVLCVGGNNESDPIFLVPGTFETDVAELRAALALTGQAQPETTRRQALGRAMLLYTGELLASMKAPWVAEERERWAIIHAAVKYEWEKLPLVSRQVQRDPTPTGWHREAMSRPPVRPAPGSRRYVRSEP
jgi:DNA-binding SARP family transcriptional activator